MLKKITNVLKRLGSNDRGFTLVELIVVIAILGILAAVLIPKLGGVIGNSKAKADLSTAKNLESIALQVYAETGVMPTGADFQTSLLPYGLRAKETPQEKSRTFVIDADGHVTVN